MVEKQKFFGSNFKSAGNPPGIYRQEFEAAINIRLKEEREKIIRHRCLDKIYYLYIV